MEKAGGGCGRSEEFAGGWRRLDGGWTEAGKGLRTLEEAGGWRLEGSWRRLEDAGAVSGTLEVAGGGCRGGWRKAGGGWREWRRLQEAGTGWRRLDGGWRKLEGGKSL